MKNWSKCQKAMVKREYTKWNLLDYSYYKSYYKLIGIDLLREANTKIPQKKKEFIEKLEEDGGMTMSFVTENQQKTILKFYLDLLNRSE